MGRRVRTLTGLWMLLELAVFVLVAYWIGLGWTILATLATSGVGLLLLGRQGTQVLSDLRDQARSGEPSGRALGDAGLVAVGGLLMVLPGFLGDVVGLLCLLPWTRPLPRWLIGRLVSDRIPVSMRGPVKVRSTRAARVGGAGTTPAGPPVVIEGEVEVAAPADREASAEPVVEGEIVEPEERAADSTATEFVAVRVVQARIVDGDAGAGENPRHVESHRAD